MPADVLTKRPEPLSVVMDNYGHKIERFPGDVLKITCLSGRAATRDEIAAVTKWYWLRVAVHGNDPETTIQGPIR